jgi:hypothetical protein
VDNERKNLQKESEDPSEQELKRVKYLPIAKLSHYLFKVLIYMESISPLYANTLLSHIQLYSNVIADVE